MPQLWRLVDLGSNLACYLSAGCPWTPHLPSPCLSLHTCEMGQQSILPRVSVKIQGDSVQNGLCRNQQHFSNRSGPARLSAGMLARLGALEAAGAACASLFPSWLAGSRGRGWSLTSAAQVGSRWIDGGKGGHPDHSAVMRGRLECGYLWGDWGELSPQVLREALGLGGGRSERGQGPSCGKAEHGALMSPSAQVSLLVWGQVGSPWLFTSWAPPGCHASGGGQAQGPVTRSLLGGQQRGHHNCLY